MIDVESLFDIYQGEYRKFSRIKNKFSNRRDLHALILLDRLCPDSENIITSADVFSQTLNINTRQLAKVATEADIIDLIRCGIDFDEEEKALHLMF